MSKPDFLVSVVIPCYNAEKYLHETLESALKQTHPPLEVIVVNDGSTDDSVGMAQTFGPPVRVISQENQGESVARNRGIEEAQGDLVAFLDADDIWFPDKLKQQVAVFQDGSVACCHTGSIQFGKRTNKPVVPSWSERRDLSWRELIVRPFVNTSTAVVRRDLPVRFPTWTTCGEDMLYFADISFHGRIAYIPDHLAGYRVHDAQQTLSAEHVVKHAKSRLRWLELNRNRLGSDATRDATAAILDDLLVTLDLAYWKRDWNQYRLLRTYLLEIWNGRELPSLLRLRILPTVFYTFKDAIDRILHRRKAGANASASS